MAMQQGRYLQLERKWLLGNKRLAGSCDQGRDVVIASQPSKVQFHRILRLLDPQIPVDPGRCGQLRLE